MRSGAFSFGDKTVAFLALCGLVLCLEFGAWWDIEPVYALNNGITIINTYTGAMTDHPVIFARVFKPGEIVSYPKPYVTPTTTGTRAAASTWETAIPLRWRDATGFRTITNARVGSPAWTRGGSPDVTNVVAANGLAEVTMPADHGLSYADRLQVTNTPSTEDKHLDNVTVYGVSTTKKAQYLQRTTVSGTFQDTASGHTYAGSGGTAITVSQKIDPLEAATTCRYYSADHGFMKGDVVNVPSFGTFTTSSDAQYVTAVTKNEFVTSATCSGSFSVNGTASGPALGSVKLAVIALFVTIPAASDTVRVDFVDDANPCSSGNDAACRTAGFSKAEMLSATWNFDLDTTADVSSASTTGTITTSARTMLTAWNEVESYCGPRYWIYGPVLTQFILEHGCALADTAATTNTADLPGATDAALPYDFGWKIRPGPTVSSNIGTGDTEFHVSSAASFESGGGTTLWMKDSSGAIETATVGGKFDANGVTTCDGVAIATGSCLTSITRHVTGAAGAYASGRGLGIKQWEDAPSTAYKSLHPRFDMIHYASGGWGPKGSTIVNNDWVDKHQNLWYSIDLKTGGTPASRITKTTIKHNNSTSWRIDLHDGTDPEFYCKDTGSGSGTDPNNCSGTGGGRRTRRFLIDHNTPYLEYTGAIPEWKLYTGQTTRLDDKISGWRSSDQGAVVGGGSLGSGTYNAQPAATGSTPLKDFSGAEEAFTLQGIQAMCLQNWNASCYEINFGDANPGGGGNVEVQHHIPYHYREDADAIPRPFYPGFPDSAFGRVISQYSRPTFVGFTGTADGSGALQHPAWDRRHEACSDSAPVVAIFDAGPGGTGGTAGWPCSWIQVGIDGWKIDYTHLNEWNEWAFMITGDPRYLDGILEVASWAHFQQANETGRSPNRSWSQPETTTSGYPLRGQGGWVQAVLSAAAWVPNVPMFGATTASADANYWNEKAWDMGYSKEGWYGIDGYFKLHYPHMDIVDPCTNQPANSIYKFVRCTIGANKANALGIPDPSTSATCAGTHAWIDCGGGSYSEEGHWYWQHTISQWNRAHEFGMPMFDYSRKRFARLAFALWNSTEWNPWLNDLYQLPAKIGSEFIQTMQNLFLAFEVTWNDGVAGSRTDTDWCHSTLTCNQTNLSYQTQWRPTMSGLKDLRTTVYSDLDGCTGTNCSWDNSVAFMDAHMSMYSDIVKFSILPHAKLYDLSCVPTGSTTASCTYTPPDVNPCKYLNGTSAPSTSLDDSYTSDGGSAATLRTVNLSSLSAATSYTFVSQCGQVVSGIADGTYRTFTSFTTDGSGPPRGKVTVRGKTTVRGTVR